MKSEHKPLLLIAIALVATMAFSSWRSMQTSDLELLPPGSATLPELTQLAGWMDGRSLNDADLEGKIVVIDCFASWCGPCEEAAPEVVRDYRRYHTQGVEFIGLTSETAEALDEVREFCTRNHIEWPIAYGAEFQLQQLGVDAIPRLFVYDAQGQGVWVSTLPGNLEQAIRVALERSGRGTRE